MPQMARSAPIAEFEIVAEHRQQMFLQPHDQRVDPGVEQHVRAFEPHLRRVTRRKVLYVDRRRNNRAWNAKPLGNVPLHLRTEHQLRLEQADGVLVFQLFVGDLGFDAIECSGLAQIARKFTVVTAKADHFEPQLVARDACRGDGVGRITEDENALAGQIS